MLLFGPWPPSLHAPHPNLEQLITTWFCEGVGPPEKVHSSLVVLKAKPKRKCEHLWKSARKSTEHHPMKRGLAKEWSSGKGMEGWQRHGRVDIKDTAKSSYHGRVDISLEHPTHIYRTSNEHLSKVQRTAIIDHTSNEHLSTIQRPSIDNPTSINRQFNEHRSTIQSHPSNIDRHSAHSNGGGFVGPGGGNLVYDRCGIEPEWDYGAPPVPGATSSAARIV